MVLRRRQASIRSTSCISTTKSFASTAAGLAIAQKKLKLDSKVGDFFPEANPPEKREITVRQLLQHDLGRKNDNGILQRQDLFNYVLNELPMAAPPGNKWEYNNSGLSILGPVDPQSDRPEHCRAARRAACSQKIRIPRSDWTWDDRDGMPLPYSGLHITARSLARFGLLALNRGMWRGEKVISSDWVAEATHASQDLNKRYGYLWWNNSTGAWPGVPADAYAAMGKFDNDMLVVPSLDMLVIRQVGATSSKTRR